MNAPLYHIDRPFKPVKIPFYRKRSFYAAYFVTVISFMMSLAIKEYLKEPLPQNVVSNTSYGRNRVDISLKPETVFNVPAYEFGKLEANRYYLDIFNSDLDYNSSRAYDYGSISRIGRQRLEDNVTRVTFDFHSLSDVPRVKYSKDDKKFVLSYNHNLEHKYVVVIDPGHGGHLPGAIGRQGTREKDVTLDISLKLADLLSEYKDIEVVMTRDEDEHIGLWSRREVADFWQADMFVSIHANSARNRRANYSEVYYSGWRSSNRENSKKLAEIMTTDLRREIGLRSKVRSRGFAVIRRNPARFGAVLVETMFISNSRGERLLRSEEYQNKIAQSLLRSINTMITTANN